MTTLNDYVVSTQRLLHNSSNTLYNYTDIVQYINTARYQLAAEGRCLNSNLTLALVAGTNSYAFSSIATGANYAGVLDIKMISLGISPSFTITMLYGRPWEWFNRNYLMTSPIPVGTPVEWAQYGSGSNGTLYVGPTPSALFTFTLGVDCAVLPAALANPQDIDILPYPWTDAVPYFASYLAFLNSQRTSDAEKMFSIYQVFTKRAREISVPTATPQNFKSPKLAQGMGGQNGAA